MYWDTVFTLWKWWTAIVIALSLVIFPFCFVANGIDGKSGHMIAGAWGVVIALGYIIPFVFFFVL